MMNYLSMVTGALAAGAAAAAKDTVSMVVKDAYAGLKSLVLSRVKNRKESEDALATLETNPELGAKELESIMGDEEIVNDPGVLTLAQQLLQLVRGEDSTGPKFHVQTSGTVQGQQIGDGGTQHNVFGVPTPRS